MGLNWPNNKSLPKKKPQQPNTNNGMSFGNGKESGFCFFRPFFCGKITFPKAGSILLKKIASCCQYTFFQWHFFVKIRSCTQKKAAFFQQNEPSLLPSFPLFPNKKRQGPFGMAFKKESK